MARRCAANVKNKEFPARGLVLSDTEYMDFAYSWGQMINHPLKCMINEFIGEKLVSKEA